MSGISLQPKKLGLIRPAAAIAQQVRQPPPARAAAFGDDDDEPAPSASDSTAAAIAREQAIRAAQAKQAEDEATKNSEMADLYDYDGFKEEESAKREKAAAANAVANRSRAAAPGTAQPAPQARYIVTLLEQAKKREDDRELARERMIAKQNALEEEEAGGEPSERFVTAAYREKLEERSKRRAEDKAQEAREEAEGVTSKGGPGMHGFYSALVKGAMTSAAATTATATGNADKKQPQPPPASLLPTSSSSSSAPVAVPLPGGKRPREGEEEEEVAAGKVDKDGPVAASSNVSKRPRVESEAPVPSVGTVAPSPLVTAPAPSKEDKEEKLKAAREAALARAAQRKQQQAP